MEGGKKKASSILTWMKRRKKKFSSTAIMTKSKSWSGGETAKPGRTGWFSVYVGPEKQRFVIKTESVNHPLFKMLLEDAELEYGFHCDGPLHLPCHVDLFCRVLAEMECGDDLDGHSSACHFSHGCHSPFSPARRRFGGGSGPYCLLTPLRSFN